MTINMTIKMLPLFAVGLMLAGCVAQASPELTSSKPEPELSGTACVPAGTWVDPATRQTLGNDQIIQRMQDKNIVLLGETHVNADHHRWQAQTIAQLYAQRPNMILGFEAFPRRVQGVLDQWVAGDLSEQAFLKASDWETVWKFDANQYMPLFHFARLNRVPMVALNVDRALTHEVSLKGWKNVSQKDRRGIGDPAPATPEYLKMLSDVYGQHNNRDGNQNGAPKSPNLTDPKFSNFVDVQLTWDRAMAEAADTALKNANRSGHDARIVAIIGRGHMDHFQGIPAQLKDLGQNDVGVLTPWDQGRACSELVSPEGVPVANAVFGVAFTDDMMGPEKPRLGVMIDATDAGIRVDDVIKDSIGEAAGLKQNDIIVQAAGTKVTQPSALVSIIKSMNPGTWLPLRVKRDKDTVELIARFPALIEEPQTPGPK